MKALLHLLLLAASIMFPALAEERSDPLQILAANTIIADVVRQVGGDHVRVTSLLQPDTDPHSFQPTPSDVSRITSCDALFLNGFELEQSLATLIAGAGGHDKIVELSANLPARRLDHGHDHPDHTHADFDPHVWFDPNLVMLWVDEIARVLGELDAAHADSFRARADHYQAQLRDLDAWIREEIARVPSEQRKLVSDHNQFGYFCDRYELENAGAIIPGFSTLSEPSARELAALEDSIRALKVKAVFVGNTVNPVLAKRVTEDTGTNLVTLYTGSLTDEGGIAPTYLQFMRYNVTAIANALK